MRILKKIGLGLLVIVVLFLVLDFFARPPAERYETVNLSGQVKMLVGPVPGGKISYRIYVLESLEDDPNLNHPLEEVVDFQSDGPQFSHTFEYPLHMGSGLAVSAWLDADGDGVFCTPTERTDPSGLAYTEETPAGDFTLDITLTKNCRQANWFYPPTP
ncbi:MAG: hypothetical protein QGG65_04070 [Gammaproteobacteria bacterium]|jgi:hypothetical protein|nr:hypothetical protein [Gammaproteobacteria bacterium]HJP05753.1 hypothetical protein [Gammaproteobacteria bacterium]